MTRRATGASSLSLSLSLSPPPPPALPVWGLSGSAMMSGISGSMAYLLMSTGAVESSESLCVKPAIEYLLSGSSFGRAGGGDGGGDGGEGSVTGEDTRARTTAARRTGLRLRLCDRGAVGSRPLWGWLSLDNRSRGRATVLATLSRLGERGLEVAERGDNEGATAAAPPSSELTLGTLALLLPLLPAPPATAPPAHVSRPLVSLATDAGTSRGLPSIGLGRPHRKQTRVADGSFSNVHWRHTHWPSHRAELGLSPPTAVPLLLQRPASPDVDAEPGALSPGDANR